LCSESIIYGVAGNTTGMNFLELHVTWSGLVPKYPVYPGNNAHVVVILLLEIARDLKWLFLTPSSSSRQANIHHCFWSWVSNRDKLHRDPLHVQDLLNSLACSIQKVLRASGLWIGTPVVLTESFVNFLHVLISAACQETAWILAVFNWNLIEKTTQKSLCSCHGIVTKSCLRAINSWFSSSKSEAKRSANAL
jgi:hypothetical protein